MDMLVARGALLAAVVTLAPAFGDAPRFTTAPTARTDGRKVRVEFAVDRRSDVTVYVEDAEGRIVRHLASGVLGANPPKPLKPNSLAQSIEWDGKDDYGRPVEGFGSAAFTVRVGLGLGARYDRVLIGDPQTLGGISSLATGPDGTLYLAMGAGGTGPVWGGRVMVALNRDGRYQRMLQPFPANLPAGRVKGFDVVELDGRPAPLVHAIQQRRFYSHFGPRKSGMCVTPGGVVLRLVGGSWKTGAPAIAAIDTQGAAVWGKYAGPKLLTAKRAGFNRRPMLCASADGKWAYVSGLTVEKRAPAAVYRVRLPARAPAEPFFGDADKPGGGKDSLGGAPRGLALDGKGHLLIADYGNNRVVVVAEADGAFAGSFAVKKPDCLAVDAATGAVYVTRDTGKGSVELVKFSGWRAPKAVARLSLKKDGNPDFPWLLAVDASARQPVVWLGGDYGSLLRIDDRGEAFGKPREINSRKIGNASFVDLSVDRRRKEVYVRCGMYWWYRYSEADGKLTKVKPGPFPSAAGSQLAAGPDGTLYSPAYAYHLLRFSRDGKPLPWAGGRYPTTAPGKKPGSTMQIKQRYKHGFYVPVSMTFLTHTIGIRHDGHVFMFEPAHPGDRPPKMLHEYLPSGRRVTDYPIIWKVSDTAVGPKFDPQGNIYIAEQVKPLERLYPGEFKGVVGPVKVGKTALEGLRRQVVSMYGSIVKFSPKGGMIHYGGENPFRGKPRLDPSLKTVDAAHFRGDRVRPVKVTGAEWIRTGVSHVDLIACNCENTRFDVDEFGRVWYPDLARFRVTVLDTNGNEMTHFGGYGNADSAGPGSRIPEPGIAFAWLIGVGVTDRYAYMGDSLNRRLLRAKLIYAAEATCSVK